MTKTQQARLEQMARREDKESRLADEPTGRAAASAWWRTMQSLERLGLVEQCRRGSHGMRSAFRLKDPS